MKTYNALRRALAWILFASLVLLSCSLLSGCSTDEGGSDGVSSREMTPVCYRYSAVVTLERTAWGAGEPVTVSVGWGDCLENAADFRAACANDSFRVQWFVSAGKYAATAYNHSPYRDMESPYTDRLTWAFSKQNKELFALSDLYHESARNGTVRNDILCLKSDSYVCEDFVTSFLVPTEKDASGAISAASFANTYTFSLPVELFQETSGALLLQTYVFDFTQGGDNGYLIPGEELVLEYTRGEDGSILFSQTVYVTSLLSKAEISF